MNAESRTLFTMCDNHKSFFDEVEDEYCKAEIKHAGWPHDHIHACAILTEEAGKLTQACNDAQTGDIPEAEAKEKMRMYAARVGAMALRFAKGLN